MVLSNIAPLLREDEQNLQINFSRNLNPVGQSHTAWKLLRQDDNTSVGTDQIVCQLLDPTGTGNPKDFAIQIRTTATSGTTGFTGQLTYTVQGKFNSIT